MKLEGLIGRWGMHIWGMGNFGELQAVPPCVRRQEKGDFPCRGWGGGKAWVISGCQELAGLTLHLLQCRG